MPASGGPATPLGRGSGFSDPAWSEDGRSIYFKRAGNVWAIDADGGEERPMTDLAGKHGELGFEPPSTDGEHLYFIWAEDLGDIWVMDVVTEDQ